MPNWTTNYVSFEGSKEKIMELKDLFSSKDKLFDFQKILPMPENSDIFLAEGDLGEKERKEFGENNWYTWSCKNWGTKWNAVDAMLEVDSENKITYYFRTAWDAPRGIIKSLIDQEILNNCTGVEWICSHESEEEAEVILTTKHETEHFEPS